MIHLPLGLLAQTVSTTRYELTRVATMSQGWHWALLAIICLSVAALVIFMYRRDTRELPVATAILLMGLRLLAFAGLLFAFLNLEKRTEREVVQNSRVVLLVDASQSMSLEDADSTSDGTGARRIDLVVNELAEGKFLTDLRRKHDVSVMRFDESEVPTQVAAFTKLAEPTGTKQVASADLSNRLEVSLAESRLLWYIAAGFLALSVVATLVFAFLRRPQAETPAYSLLIGVVCLIAAVVVLAVWNLRNPDIGVPVMLGQEEVNDLERRLAARQEEEIRPRTADAKIDWAVQLAPAGNETRLGEALIHTINKERGGPVAGIVLITDGRSNAGLPYTDAVQVAQQADMPIFTVGIGSNARPQNVAVVDLEAPSRVYPGDKFNITGFLQGFELAGRNVRVKLMSYPPTPDENPRQKQLEEERTVRLGENGDLIPIKFEVQPEDESGRRVYSLEVEAPQGDHNVRDNQRTATVQIVERRTRVLLLAGGPTREFQFLRNLLYRDKETVVDVYLQTGRPGISQEAHDILYEFPESSNELFEYDCIVAFDPNWEAFDDGQIRLLEEWVDRQAGGLIVVAGPVYTPKWAGQRRGSMKIDILKGLYPVVFYNRGTSLGLGKFGSEETSQLEFTREGLEAPFLWLADTAAESEKNWAGFDGVYGYYAVKDVKEGATIYCHFTNEDEAVSDEMPVYMAGQFYGAGRVFFMASGEIWRLRSLDDSYFETFWTKLVRHVSQGRLLRDSQRGVLMVENQRYKIGEPVSVRAQLYDAQHRPLSAKQLPEVNLVVRLPDNTQANVPLRSAGAVAGDDSAGRAGMYSGQFTAMQAGDYSLRLAVPGASPDDVLTQEIAVRAPRKEIERPERNDQLLEDLARRTGGQMFVGMPMATGRAGGMSLASRLESRERMTPLPDLPDRLFDRQLMTWLLTLVVGTLCLEWIVRRLSRLA